MGEIYQKAKIRNTWDVDAAKNGYIRADEVRELEVRFLVDTGATLVGLPMEMIERIGLNERYKASVQMGDGEVTRRIFSPVCLRVMDREADVAVMELLPQTPPIMGYISLEALDLCVNPSEGILMGNPKHGGRMLLKLL